MSDSYLEHAFHEVCNKAIKCEGCYVALMERVPFYGGPEEGGWWGTDTNVVAYQHFPSEELAHAAADRVRELAEKLSVEAKREYGQQCLREMEWLDARGLDADYLPEPDGEREYYVTVTDELPTPSYGCRHYE